MQLIDKAPILPADNVRIRRFGSPDTDGVKLYVFYDVLDELLFHAKYREGRASSTLLTGGAYSGPAGPYIEVRGFVEATYLRNTDAWVRTLRARYHTILADLRASDPTQSILGWSHGSPGSGAAVDAELLRVHLSFFNLAHQVLLCLDPSDESLGFYRRRPGGPLENVGFNAIALGLDGRSDVSDDEGAEEVDEVNTHGPDPPSAGGTGRRPEGAGSLWTIHAAVDGDDDADADGDADGDADVDGAGDAAGQDASAVVATQFEPASIDELAHFMVAFNKASDDSAAVDDEISDAFDAIGAVGSLHSAQEVDIEEHVVTDEAWLTWSATDAPRASDYDMSAAVERDVSDLKAKFEELKRKRRLAEQNEAQSEPDRDGE